MAAMGACRARWQKVLGAAGAGRKRAALPPSGNETPAGNGAGLVLWSL